VLHLFLGTSYRPVAVHLPRPALGTKSGLHPKTLQRRLAAENTTFAELVDQTRRDTARRRLLGTDLSLHQICGQLGYSEQSVLTRSCNRWFNSTPAAYRSTTSNES
jgi:AraC-like DNA-binding protein